VHALRARDVAVRALVRERRRGSRLVAWGAELAEGDVTDPASLRAAFAGVDAVVHLVAIIRGSRSDFERVMAQGTRNVVAAAKEAGVRRFVLASALGLDERTKDAVPYFAAKWEMERAVKESALEYVILRPSFVFGKDGGVLPTFVRLARLAPVTPIVGPGTQRLQPIWVEDVAEYYAQSVDLPAAANRTFEVGGPDAPTWNEFWDRLKRVLGVHRPSIHVPFSVLRVQAALTERLPLAPVTRDQLTMIELGDNVVTSPVAVETFQFPLVPLDEQLRRAAS
jgi:NADH dehydrogenase